MTQIPAGTKFIGIGASVPTPENKSSQNNGFQEVYTLEDLQENVLDLTTPPDDGDVLTYTSGAPAWAPPAGGSEYTETIVNISSAQILAMATSPIELLPAPGVGKYYDINKMLFEFTYGNTVYAIDGVDPEYIIFAGAASGAVANISPDLIISPNNYYLIINNTFLDSNLQLQGNYALNQPLTMTTANGQNFINGNGTLRVKIYHKRITFGA